MKEENLKKDNSIPIGVIIVGILSYFVFGLSFSISHHLWEIWALLLANSLWMICVGIALVGSMKKKKTKKGQKGRLG